MLKILKHTIAANWISALGSIMEELKKSARTNRPPRFGSAADATQSK